MKKIMCACLAFAMLFCVLCTGCTQKTAKEYSQEFYTMDTVITIMVLADDEQKANQALNDAQQCYQEINNATDRFAKETAAQQRSDVWRINQNAGIAPVAVGQDVLNMVEESLIWGEKSGGAFNIVMGGVADAWGFGTRQYRVPERDELKAQLALCDLDNVILDKENNTVYLKNSGMVMDLGAIAKGYATDKAVAALKDNGTQNAIINAGGNVYALGKKVDRQWSVGIQHPRKADGLLGIISASDIAVISSGDYQRYFEQDGVRYHHIFDPRTGYPADACIASTIMLESATQADILSTICFILGPNESAQLFYSDSALSDGAELVAVLGQDGQTIEVYGSSNMQGKAEFSQGVKYQTVE